MRIRPARDFGPNTAGACKLPSEPTALKPTRRVPPTGPEDVRAPAGPRLQGIRIHGLRLHSRGRCSHPYTCVGSDQRACPCAKRPGQRPAAGRHLSAAGGGAFDAGATLAALRAKQAACDLERGAHPYLYEGARPAGAACSNFEGRPPPADHGERREHPKGMGAAPTAAGVARPPGTLPPHVPGIQRHRRRLARRGVGRPRHAGRGPYPGPMRAAPDGPRLGRRAGRAGASRSGPDPGAPLQRPAAGRPPGIRLSPPAARAAFLPDGAKRRRGLQ